LKIKERILVLDFLDHFNYPIIQAQLLSKALFKNLLGFPLPKKYKYEQRFNSFKKYITLTAQLQ